MTWRSYAGMGYLDRKRHGVALNGKIAKAVPCEARIHFASPSVADIAEELAVRKGFGKPRRGIQLLRKANDDCFSFAGIVLQHNAAGEVFACVINNARYEPLYELRRQRANHAVCRVILQLIIRIQIGQNPNRLPIAVRRRCPIVR